MWEWIAENLWAVWLIAMVLLLIIEITMLDLIFLMLSAGAAAALIGDFLGANLPVQVGIFSVVSLLMLLAARPTALRHLNKTDAAPTGLETMIGDHAEVLEPVDTSRGLVRYKGEDWTARSDEVMPIPYAAEVEILKIDGAILWVKQA